MALEKVDSIGKKVGILPTPGMSPDERKEAQEAQRILDHMMEINHEHQEFFALYQMVAEALSGALRHFNVAKGSDGKPFFEYSETSFDEHRPSDCPPLKMSMESFSERTVSKLAQSYMDSRKSALDMLEKLNDKNESSSAGELLTLDSDIVKEWAKSMLTPADCLRLYKESPSGFTELLYNGLYYTEMESVMADPTKVITKELQDNVNRRVSGKLYQIRLLLDSRFQSLYEKLQKFRTVEGFEKAMKKEYKKELKENPELTFEEYMEKQEIIDMMKVIQGSKEFSKAIRKQARDIFKTLKSTKNALLSAIGSKNRLGATDADTVAENFNLGKEKALNAAIQVRQSIKKHGGTDIDLSLTGFQEEIVFASPFQSIDEILKKFSKVRDAKTVILQFDSLPEDFDEDEIDDDFEFVLDSDENIEKLKQAAKDKKLTLSVVIPDEDYAQMLQSHDIVAEDSLLKVSESLKKRADLMGAPNVSKEDFVYDLNKELLPAYLNYHQEFRYLYDMLHGGQIVETDYVKSLVQKVVPILRKNPPTIVYLYGDFGTGKTAIAKHICKVHLKLNPLVISGNKFLETSDFTEEFRIMKLNPNDYFNKIAESLGHTELQKSEESTRMEIMKDTLMLKGSTRKELTEYMLQELATNPDFKLSEKDVEDQIANLFDNQVHGMYVMGKMYQAMCEGRPLIIDEANAITPEVLISFNDLLTKKIGEIVQRKGGHKPFTVKEGFCVIWTGNRGDRYKKARHEMDPATFSRLYPVEVRYLPQSTEVAGNTSDLFKRLHLDTLVDETYKDTSEQDMYTLVKESRERAKSDQIFQVLLLKLMQSRKGFFALTEKGDPYSLFKDLYRLSAGAKLIMDLFERNLSTFPNVTNTLKEFLDEGTPINIAAKIEKANLSMRELLDFIVGSYLEEAGRMDISYYVHKFVERYLHETEEAVIIYAFLQSVGLFTKEHGWPQLGEIKGDNASERMAKFRSAIGQTPETMEGSMYNKLQQNGDGVTLLENTHTYEMRFFSELELMQLVFGYLPPVSKADLMSMKKLTEEDNSVELNDQRLRNYMVNISRRFGLLLDSDAVENMSSDQILIIRKAIDRTKLFDAEKVAAMTVQEVFDGCGEIAMAIIELLHELGEYDDEQYENAKNADVETQMQLAQAGLQNLISK